MRRLLAVGLVLAGPALGAARASAQEAQGDVDRARALARESTDLLDRQRYADALDRATRAEGLYHAPFHVAVIAQALEGLGRLAEAAAKYEQLIAEPLPPSAPRVFHEAQERGKQRLRQLLARVPSLLVVVRGGAPHATATVDGAPVALGAGLAVRFDPGPHEVKVTAAGFRPFARTVTLPERGGVVIVEATLEPEGAQPAGAAAPAPTPSPPERGPRGGSLAPAAAAFGVGGAGLVMGAVSGALFLGKLSGLDARCPRRRCDSREQPELDAARRLGTISTTGFVVGAVGVAAGAILLGLRPGGARVGGQRAAAQAAVTPWIGPSAGGVAGRF
jgi:hypothetical protein